MPERTGRPFGETLQGIVAVHKRLLLGADGPTMNTDKQITGTPTLSRPPVDYGNESRVLESILERLLFVFKKREKQIDFVAAYGAVSSAEPSPNDAANRARRTLALGLVGFSPIEVAYMLDYSEAKKVEELRRRHGRDAKTGAKVTTLTAPARDAIGEYERKGDAS